MMGFEENKDTPLRNQVREDHCGKLAWDSSPGGITGAVTNPMGEVDLPNNTDSDSEGEGFASPSPFRRNIPEPLKFQAFHEKNSPSKKGPRSAGAICVKRNPKRLRR